MYSICSIRSRKIKSVYTSGLFAHLVNTEQRIRFQYFNLEPIFC